MQEKQDATSTKNEEQSDLVPIFKMELPNYPHLPIIEGFDEFFKTKVPGSWLIRESRTEGMISVTLKRDEGKIAHTRFAFIEDKWVLVNNTMRDKHIDGSSIITYEHVDRVSVKSKFELLLEAINDFSNKSTNKFTLKSDKMIKPVWEQATKQQAYYIDSVSYVTTKQRTTDQAIYANLLQSLEKVNGVIRDCMANLNANKAVTKDMKGLDSIKLFYNRITLSNILRRVSKPFKSDNHAQKLKDLFDDWLAANALTFDLLCPVLLTLFEEPYYVVETGMVYDAAALFSNGTLLSTCPLTRTKIEDNPVHFDGYRRKLYSTLELFFDLIKLYQAKMVLDKEKKEELSALPSLSLFAPSSFNDDASALSEHSIEEKEFDADPAPFSQ
ncbi:hypothetical protein [Legionella rowbothamii]|uniref:hypothetical protein n=1 Tax=Legionella rowbothamii TaxID=96229 RepID=UPI001055F2D5|nr:hypothetical protein [Legionella rowbothamii]